MEPFLAGGLWPKGILYFGEDLLMTDSTLSNEWAIGMLSHQKCRLTLELLNRKTMRAHKLIYEATGTDTIQKLGTWGKGHYYQKFETKIQANFENFNGTL